MKWLIILILAIILITGYFILNKQNEIVCNAPFIRYGNQCCLDQNNDGACDKSEPQPMSIDTWQGAIDSVDRLTTHYTLNCEGGIKENVLYVIHIIQSQNYIECSKLKERIDVIKSKPGLFESYLKVIDDCDSNTMNALVKTIKGFGYGRLLPLKTTISNSDDFYYIYSGCVHEPDQTGGIFSFFQMAVDTQSGITAGMSSR
jgi:hypothetical protein